MRTYEDSFSGAKIYPGKGKIYVRGDSKIFRFQNGKSESLFLQRKNPRQLAWTVLSRRHRRKGQAEAQTKTRRRKMVKSSTRGVAGVTFDVIKAKRTEKPAARLAARTEATEKAKQAKRDRQAAAKQNKSQVAAGSKTSKMGAKGAAQKVAATSR